MNSGDDRGDIPTRRIEMSPPPEGLELLIVYNNVLEVGLLMNLCLLMY